MGHDECAAITCEIEQITMTDVCTGKKLWERTERGFFMDS